MKKLILAFSATFLLCSFSCEQETIMEASITNKTTQKIFVDFKFSDFIGYEPLEIAPDASVVFQTKSSAVDDNLQPSLEKHDSIVFMDSSKKILRVYKPSDSNKTIYNINSYWSSTSSTKNFIEYEYEIDHQDFTQTSSSSLKN